MLALTQPAAWESWNDQALYLTSAKAFLHGDLTPSRHWYPLLYPLTIAPFAWMAPIWAVTVPDALAYGASFAGFAAVARRFGLGPWAALIVFLPTTVTYPWLGGHWLRPWTTTLSAALIWLSLGLACACLEADRARGEVRRGFMLGVLLGLIPLCRPADSVVSAAIGLCLIVPLLRGQRWREIAAIIGGGALAIIAYAALYLAIYGFALTDYTRLSLAQGENLRWLGWKAYLILVEPQPWYPSSSSILKLLPWLPLGIAGAVVALVRDKRRGLIVLLVLPAAAYIAVMLAYIELWPSGLWQYGNIHYFKWPIPLAGLFAVEFCRGFATARRLSSAVLAMVLFAASVRCEPVPAGDMAPAKLLMISAPAAPNHAIYFARSVIIDREGSLRNGYEYSQVPDGHGHMVIDALRRDFAGGEHWRNDGSAAFWPYMPQNPPVPLLLPGPATGAAIGRYRPQLAIGWPCWLPPYACPTDLPKPPHPTL